MSSELCPFCGKSFKRLKSHLPHCKAAKNSATTSPQHEESKMSAASSSSPLPSFPPNRAQRSVKPQASTQQTPLDTRPNKQLLKPPTTAAKKTKLKLSEQIKMAAETSSPASVASSPSSSTSKSKKKAAISSQRSKLEKRNLSLVSSSEKVEEIEKTGMGLNQKSSKKMAGLKKIKKSSSDEGQKVSVNSVKTSPKDTPWWEEEDNEKSLAENDAWTSRQEARITLHDVRASLGRAKQNGLQKRSSFVDKLPTDDLESKILNPNESALVCVQQETPSQVMALSPGKSQLLPTKSRDFLGDLSKAENKECAFGERANMLAEGLRMDRHTMGALSSPSRTFLEAEVSANAFRKDFQPLLKPNNQKAETTEEQRRQDGGQRGTRAALSQQRLGQVMLRELPDWLVLHSPRRPRDALQMLHRGWQWYYRRYIDVKRGGVGGVAMLLVGYCALSYVWTFPLLKRERWRKYH